MANIRISKMLDIKVEKQKIMGKEVDSIFNSLNLEQESIEVELVPYVLEVHTQVIGVEALDDFPETWIPCLTGRGYIEGNVIVIPYYTNERGDCNSLDEIVKEIARMARILYLRKRGVKVSASGYAMDDESYAYRREFIEADAYAYAYMISYSRLNPEKYLKEVRASGEFDYGMRQNLTRQLQLTLFKDHEVYGYGIY